MDVMHSTLRDMEHFHTKLIQENDKLSKESEFSKVILYLVQENIQLRATNQTLREATALHHRSGGGGSGRADASSVTVDNSSNSVAPSILRESCLRFDDTGGGDGSSFHPLVGEKDFSGFVADPPADKSSFYRHLQQNDGHNSTGVDPPSGGVCSASGSAPAPPPPTPLPRASSPENFHAYLSTLHADDDESSDSVPNVSNTNKQPPPRLVGDGASAAAAATSATTTSGDAAASAFLRGVRQPGRILGEIAFQLDQRILSHIFQGQTRLYGFTVHNIADKIRDVSVHPVTGRADDAYRRRLARRHAELMRRLAALGYKEALHPTFTEFVVNAYGIVEQRGGGGGDAREGGESQDDARLNDADFLARLVASAAPSKLHKDLMVLLRCLATMAADDGRPLFLW